MEIGDGRGGQQLPRRVVGGGGGGDGRRGRRTVPDDSQPRQMEAAGRPRRMEAAGRPRLMEATMAGVLRGVTAVAGGDGCAGARRPSRTVAADGHGGQATYLFLAPLAEGTCRGQRYIQTSADPILRRREEGWFMG